MRLISIAFPREGGEVAAEYREFYGEHAYDEQGNYIGPEFGAEAAAGADTGAAAGADTGAAAGADTGAAAAPDDGGDAPAADEASEEPPAAS